MTQASIIRVKMIFNFVIFAIIIQGILCDDSLGINGAPSPMGGAPGTDTAGGLQPGGFPTSWQNVKKGPHYFKGTNNGPKISIKVSVSFRKDKNSDPFPDGSCLRLRLEDNTRRGSPAIIHYEEYIDLTQKVLASPYTISINRPDGFSDGFSVDSVINVGWCSKGSDSWIRQGDYLDDRNRSIVPTNSKDEYETNLKLKYYGY